MEKYGLTEKETELLKSAFEKFPQVETIFIYGSRAKNTFRKTSDIDLAVRFKNGGTVMTKLKSALDDLPIIYEIDLTDEAKIQSGDFKDEYERTKQIFYIKGWKTTTLGAVADVIGGGTPKTDVQEYWNGAIPWLSVGDFNNNGRWVYKTKKTITEKGVKNSSTRLLNAGDLIISARGTVGAFAQLKFPMTFNQSCYGIKAKKYSENDFLYYLLKYSIPQIKKNVHGAIFDTITRDTLEEIEITLPSLTEQRAIVAVLSSLDDKIELLRDQNKTLEATAQAIFKEWFVNFNFPGANGKMIDSELGKIPEGWQVGKLGEEAQTILGGTPSTDNKEYWENGTVPWINSGKVNEFRIYKPTAYITRKALEESATKIMPKGAVVIAITGATLGQVSRLEIESTGNQSVIGVIANKKSLSTYLYYWMLQNIQDIVLIATGGAQQHINKNDVNELAFLMPGEIALTKFFDISNPIIEKISNNCFQIETLSTLRDALLPKLMKGELRVKEIC